MSDNHESYGWIPSCGDGDISDDQLRALRAEAAAAGDRRQVEICDDALAGDLQSKARCQRVIAEAQAQREDQERYPVPAGLQRKPGVEYGCGEATCTGCYEPQPSPTAGPWTVDRALARHNRVISGPQGEVVAEVLATRDIEGDETSDDPERDATARLIAKAPELLQLVADAVDVLDAEGIVYGNSLAEPLDVLRRARALLKAVQS